MTLHLGLQCLPKCLSADTLNEGKFNRGEERTAYICKLYHENRTFPFLPKLLAGPMYRKFITCKSIRVLTRLSNAQTYRHIRHHIFCRSERLPVPQSSTTGMLE